MSAPLRGKAGGSGGRGPLPTPGSRRSRSTSAPTAFATANATRPRPPTRSWSRATGSPGPRSRAVVSKLAQKEHGRLIAIALGAPTEPRREVFALRYEEGLSYEKIGQILGLKTGAARALAHRAKAALRKEFGLQVWDSAANNLKERRGQAFPFRTRAARAIASPSAPRGCPAFQVSQGAAHVRGEL
jgi:hypothetical protein